MAQSVAYILSAPYQDYTEAYNVGLEQGTRVVYALDSEGSVTKFFGDSELTFIVYGNSTSPYQGDWYAFRLLSNPEASTSMCTIGTDGLVSID